MSECDFQSERYSENVAAEIDRLRAELAEARANAERFRNSMYAVEGQATAAITRAAQAEVERDAILDRFKSSIDTRLSNVLCEMKEGYDDSIVGFNEAWDVMRKVFDDFKARAAINPSPAGRED